MDFRRGKIDLFKIMPEDHPMWMLAGILHWTWSSRRQSPSRDPYAKAHNHSFWGSYAQLCSWATLTAALRTAGISWETCGESSLNEEPFRHCFSFSADLQSTTFENRGVVVPPPICQPLFLEVHEAWCRYYQLFDFCSSGQRQQGLIQRYNGDTFGVESVQNRLDREVIKAAAFDAVKKTNNVALKVFRKHFLDLPLVEQKVSMGIFRMIELGFEIAGFGAFRRKVDKTLQQQGFWCPEYLPHRELRKEDDDQSSSDDFLLHLRNCGFLVPEAKQTVSLLQLGRLPSWWFKLMVTLGMETMTSHLLD